MYDAYDKEEDEDDVFDDWNGRDVDADAATRRSVAARGGDGPRPGARRLALGLLGDPPLAPGLYAVGTPIGNVEDITLRALRVLRSADAVLAEDTRHTGRLLARDGLENGSSRTTRIRERARRDHLVARIAGGAALALVSDAGTPAVSDPGADLVKACADACLSVVPIPGPCAPAAAIAPRALTEGNEPGFSFIGFLPPRRARDVRGGASQTRPGRSWRSHPRKLVATLQDARGGAGGRTRVRGVQGNDQGTHARRDPFWFFWFFSVFLAPF